jgi:diacylglycerol kinase (ATP)
MRRPARIRLVFNPRAGRAGRAPVLAEQARAFAAARAWEVAAVATRHPGHATTLAREALAEGCELVVAIGGDGTLNEVASALVGTDATLGLLPCGSGNGLARHLGLTARGAAWAALAGGAVRRIDSGTAAGRPFFNAAGLGFDAVLSERFNRLAVRGPLAYARATLGALRAYRPEPYIVHLAGQAPLRASAFLVAAANSDEYGNACRIAPGARVDDGRLDLTLLRRVDAWTALPLAARLFSGRLVANKEVLRWRAESCVIERTRPGLLHTDGEAHAGPAAVEIRIRPASLSVLVPPASLPKGSA